jgi:hypothetical protein
MAAAGVTVWTSAWAKASGMVQRHPAGRRGEVAEGVMDVAREAERFDRGREHVELAEPHERSGLDIDHAGVGRGSRAMAWGRVSGPRSSGRPGSAVNVPAQSARPLASSSSCTGGGGPSAGKARTPSATRMSPWVSAPPYPGSSTGSHCWSTACQGPASSSALNRAAQSETRDTSPRAERQPGSSSRSWPGWLRLAGSSPSRSWSTSIRDTTSTWST